MHSFLSPRVNNSFIAVIVLTRYLVDKVNAPSKITITSMLTLHESSRFRHRDPAKIQAKHFRTKTNERKYLRYFKRFLQITRSFKIQIHNINIIILTKFILTELYFKHKKCDLLLWSIDILNVKNFWATNKSFVQNNLRLCRKTNKNSKRHSFWNTLYKR